MTTYEHNSKIMLTYWSLERRVLGHLSEQASGSMRVSISHLMCMFISISACNCENTGSIGVSCDNEGKCQCKENFDGNRCEKCKEGFYNYPICEGNISHDFDSSSNSSKDDRMVFNSPPLCLGTPLS